MTHTVLLTRLRGHDGNHDELAARWLLEDYTALTLENIRLRVRLDEVTRERDAASVVVLLGVIAFVVALAVLVAVS